MKIQNTIKDNCIEIINDTNDKIYSESLCYFKIKQLLSKKYPTFKVMKKNQEQYPVGLTSIPYYIELRSKTENFIFYDDQYCLRNLATDYTRNKHITLHKFSLI